jgi:hypothetical protein
MEYTVEELKKAARKALEDNNEQAAKRFVDAARRLEVEQAAKAARDARMTTPEKLQEGAKSLAAGGIRGAAETVGTVGNLASFIQELPMNIALRVMGKEPPKTASKGPTLREKAADITGGFSEYKSPTTFGQYLGTMGEFGGGSAMLPIGGPVRAVAQSVFPALASETAGQLTKGTEKESMARLLAALGTPFATEALKSGARRLVTGPDALIAREGAERAGSVGILQEADVPMTTGQAVGSERLMRLEGVEATDLATTEGVTKQVMRLLGSDAARATPKALAERKTFFGSVFDQAEEVVDEVATQSDVNNLKVMIDTFRDATDENIPKVIRELTSRIDNSFSKTTPISGEKIADYRTRIRKMIETAKGDERATLGMAANELLDNILERGVGKVDANLYNLLRDVRPKYRDYLTALRALNRSGSDPRSGLISPNALGTATRLREGTKYLTGEGRSQLGDLAFAAEEVVSSLPTVSAGGRRAVTGLPALTGLVAGSQMGDTTEALIGAGLGVAAPTLAQAAIRSGPVQRGLLPPDLPLPSRLLERLSRQTGGLLSID